MLDGESVKSCTMFAVQADGREITTVQGLAENGNWHPMQTAFHEQHGYLQTDSPSSKMVHAPQLEVLHPTIVPVRFSPSRR